MQVKTSLDSCLSTENMSRFKVVVLGEQGVGKSALVCKFTYSVYEENYQPTIGIDFSTKTLDLNGVPVRLQIWDTAGQERFRCLIPSYLRDCHAIVVCFDVTSSCSLDKVIDWIELAQTERLGRVQKPSIVLIGNKVDDTNKRQVTYESASMVAEHFGIPYIETSAKTGFNVELLFRKIAKDLYVEYHKILVSGENSEKEEKDHGIISTLEKERCTSNAIPTKRLNTCKCS